MVLMMKLVRRSLPAFAAGLMLAFAVAPARAQEQLTVFAAASLREVLDAIASEWEKGGKPRPRLVYAGSGALARQLEQGAPADVFISADDQWMNYAVEKKSVLPDSRKIIAGNSLVVVAEANSPRKIEFREGMSLEPLVAGGRLVIGDEKSVPAGNYAKQSLEFLKLWDAAQPSLVRVENVRVALALVARGEAATGIVYGSDAAAEPKVKVIGTFPANAHPVIRYPAGLTPAGQGRGAQAFLDFLVTDASKALFAKHGLTGAP